MTKHDKFREKTSVLFVCLGNICRSPAAEGIMTHIVEKNKAAHLFEIDSAGIGPWHVGELPDRRMRCHGADHGYDFSTRARQICRDDLRRFDYIIVMDRENYHEVSAMAETQEERGKIHMMTDYATHHPDHSVVPDPYYGGDRGFELVIELLEDACQGLFQHIRQEAGKN
ncbi:MAG: low molecular weight protein-tyrosine-phosphatase [Prevotella sp.]